MTASSEENERLLRDAARRLLERQADFEAGREIVKEALDRKGQRFLMPGWEGRGEIMNWYVEALREHHHAFRDVRWKQSRDVTEVHRLRDMVDSPYDSPSGFTNVLAYCEWLHMDPPLHPSQLRRVGFETTRIPHEYQPRPEWEEHFREEEEKAQRERELKQKRERRNRDEQA